MPLSGSGRTARGRTSGRAPGAVGPGTGLRATFAARGPGTGLRATFAALAALTTLSGCAGGPPAAAPIVVPPTTPVATPSAGTGVDELHLPIEQYMLTPVQSVQFEWVRKAATGSCMKRYGLDYPVPAKPGPDDTAARTYTPMNRRYGVTEPDSAARWGYHMPQTAAAPAAGEQPASLAALPAAARTVLLGVDQAQGTRATSYQGKPLPDGGCFAELDRIMPGAAGGPQGPGNGPQGAVTEIKSGSFTESKSAPEVAAAIAAWTGCMKEHGFDLPDPLQAPTAVPSMKDPVPSATEIAQAVADVDCKRRTNLTGIWFATESTLQNVAIGRRAKDLATVKAALDSEVRSLGRLLDHDWSSPAPPTL
ncbi:hypothetical protein ACF9IK_25225 [Kitasatospora hibisci]|uniref:hypothetical protein n=1 Tax=Kitasatospora hibisci TaxID=3369522 RepID=UPI003754A8FA